MSQNRLIALFDMGSPDVFGDMFDIVIANKIPYSLGPGDCIVLEGGSDISPSHYGQKPIKHTQSTNWQRDRSELRLIEDGAKAGAKFLGICRGAQFLTAYAGGSLIQHVSGHHTSHWITTKDGKQYWSSSVHHQMMNPFELPDEEYELIATSETNRSDYYLIEQEGRPVDIRQALPEEFAEPEIVWYSKIKGLAIQGHPEFMRKGDAFVNYCRELVKEKVLGHSC